MITTTNATRNHLLLEVIFTHGSSHTLIISSLHDNYYVTNIITVYNIHYYYYDYLRTNHLIVYSLVHNMIITTIVTNITTI